MPVNHDHVRERSQPHSLRDHPHGPAPAFGSAAGLSARSPLWLSSPLHSRTCNSYSLTHHIRMQGSDRPFQTTSSGRPHSRSPNYSLRTLGRRRTISGRSLSPAGVRGLAVIMISPERCRSAVLQTSIRAPEDHASERTSALDLTFMLFSMAGTTSSIIILVRSGRSSA